MINALFSSKSSGTKLFKRGKQHCSFGWDTIIAMYRREVGRAKQQLTRMIPRLKEVHCIRDSWTKLNVSPANHAGKQLTKPSTLSFSEFCHSKSKS